MNTEEFSKISTPYMRRIQDIFREIFFSDINISTKKEVIKCICIYLAANEVSDYSKEEEDGFLKQIEFFADQIRKKYSP